eukprot:scaffold74021_cov80-Phaeocystis_antarctica.AAC.1
MAGRSASSAAAIGRRGATTRWRKSLARRSSTTRTLEWLSPPRRTEATTWRCARAAPRSRPRHHRDSESTPRGKQTLRSHVWLCVGIVCTWIWTCEVIDPPLRSPYIHGVGRQHAVLALLGFRRLEGSFARQQVRGAASHTLACHTACSQGVLTRRAHTAYAQLNASPSPPRPHPLFS